MKREPSIEASTLHDQREVCARHRSAHHPCAPDSRVGIAPTTLHLQPLNARRHPAEHGTCGWYIWGCNELSTDPDFFSALHVAHLPVRAPALLRFLGLPPGLRVLLAPDDEDVWFDPKLLTTREG